MTRIHGLLVWTLTLAALGLAACSPAEGDQAGAGGNGPATAAIPEPDAAVLLIPPPPASAYDARASAGENEDLASGPRRYGSSGEFRAESTVTYVYLTDRSLEDVGRYFVEAAEQSPHYVDLEDMIADYASGALDVQEEPAAGLPPDEMEAAIREYARQGVMDEQELEESLANIPAYRRIYPKIRDVTLRTLELDVEEESDGVDRYRAVDIEIVRPYVDMLDFDVDDRTAILYTVHAMTRKDG